MYDAFSRNLLLSELEMAYNGNKIVNTNLPKMNQFIKYITGADKTAALDFWTSYLIDADTKPLLRSVPDNAPVLHRIERSTTIPIAQLHGSKLTIPTIIEVATGLAIAHELGCSDVIFYSDRSGWNLPVEGIQDLIGSTTLFLPVRVHIDAGQKIQGLLHDAYNLRIAMMPHEHLGWVELRKMTQLKIALRHSINLNVNPHPLASSGQGLGLEYRCSDVSFDDPFGINVDPYEGRMAYTIYYDERFIDLEVVDRLLERIETMLLRVLDFQLRPDLTVGCILAVLRNDG